MDRMQNLHILAAVVMISTDCLSDYEASSPRRGSSSAFGGKVGADAVGDTNVRSGKAAIAGCGF